MAEKNDDEVSIDLSSIKNIFKKRAEKPSYEDGSLKEKDEKSQETEKMHHEKGIMMESSGKEEEKKELDEKESAKSEAGSTQDLNSDNKKDAAQEIHEERNAEEKKHDINEGHHKKMNEEKDFLKRSADGDEEEHEVKSVPKSEAGRHKEQAKEAENKDKDDDIALDFSKIKGIFSRPKGKKPQATEKAKEDEGEIDLGKTMSRIKSNKEVLAVALILLICVSFAIYLRVQPAYLPATEEWARSSIYNQIRNEELQRVNQQNPFLPEQNKREIAEARFQERIRNERSQIEEQVEQLAAFFRSRLQDDTGQTYLTAIDPYFWYRHTHNYLEHGHAWDIEVDGVYFDAYRMAPLMEEDIDSRLENPPTGLNALGGNIGRTYMNLHIILQGWIYRFLRFFGSDISLMAVAFYAPVLIGALMPIPAFFIVKKLSKSNVGGFFAAFLVAIHPFILTRTIGGFSDTDGYNILFPLLITWVVLEAFDAKDMKKTMLLAGLSGLLMGIFAFAWQGWAFIFNIVGAAIGLFVIYEIVMHYKDFRSASALIRHGPIRKNLAILAGFIVSSGIFVTFFTGLRDFMGGFTQVFRFAAMREIAVRTVWFNVFTTVAELNPLNYRQIIQQTSGASGNLGALIFSIAVIGTLLCITRRNKEGKIDLLFAGILSGLSLIAVFWAMSLNSVLFFMVFVALIAAIMMITSKNLEGKSNLLAVFILILWFFSTMYASERGVRFVLLLAPAFSLGIGVAFGILYNRLSEFVSKEFKISRLVTGIIIIAILSLFVVEPWRTAHATSRNMVPSFNDAWYETLTKIRDNSNEDALITSWWDFGHWFKSIGDRGVNLDGGGQNQPAAHWLGRLLLTSDEKASVGMIRMLNCGKHLGFLTIFEENNDTAAAIDILYEIQPLERDEARDVLLRNFSEETADKILGYTHCEPTENFVITSQDMVQKSGVWGHFGSWDFHRATMYQRVARERNYSEGIRILMEEFNLSEDVADRYFHEIRTTSADQWITGWPSYVSNLNACSEIGNETLQCDTAIGRDAIRVEVNMTTMDAVITNVQGTISPHSIVYPVEDGIEERVFEGETIPFSIALVPEDNTIRSIMMSPELATSMFTRLFFYRGHGLEHFELFHYTRDVTGANIFTWKVNWEGIDRTEEQLQDEQQVIEIDLHDLDLTEEIEIDDVLAEIEGLGEEEDWPEEEEESLEDVLLEPEEDSLED